MLFLILALIIGASAYLFLSNRFKYWKIRGVDTLKGQNVLFGDLTKTFLGRENFLVTFDKAYHEFKSRGCKFGGIYSFNNPMLLIVDPEIARYILAKDSEYFLGRGIEFDEENKPVSAHMFNLDGEEWRFIRRKLTPTFTTGKLKSMFRIIEEKLDKFCEVVGKREGEDIYMADLIERAGMDIIAETAFGLNCNALEDEVSPFYKATVKVCNPSIWRIIYISLKLVTKNHANIALLLSDDPVCNDFFINIIRDTVKYRKENNIKANDFLQLLIELMEPKDGEEGLTLNKVAAQAFLFFIAAYETGARALNLTLYELGKDLELQEMLRREIMEVLDNNNNTLSYDIVKSCKLLDAVVKENSRKNTAVVFLNRVCVKNYTIPGTSVTIEAGTPVVLPLYSFHNDPDNFPEPQVFDANRFSKENEGNIKPFTYMPFGEGPRFCIGNRLGEYQLKTAVIKMLKNFEISVSPKTEEPLTFSPITSHLLLTFKQKIYFNVKRLKH